MTTPLLTAAHDLNLTTVAAMDLLQNAGIISDNCITLDDVAKADQIRAANWLRMNAAKRRPTTKTETKSKP